MEVAQAVMGGDVPMAILQVVGRRLDVSLHDEWGDLTPRTQIVAIGAPHGIDEEELTSRLDACLVQY